VKDIGSAIFSLGIAVAGVVVFVGFVLYDTSKVMRGEGTPLQNALSLYLDFVNLFVDLLRILSQRD
jgi:FtsH-binding integral membrane protein